MFVQIRDRIFKREDIFYIQYYREDKMLEVKFYINDKNETRMSVILDFTDEEYEVLCARLNMLL